MSRVITKLNYIFGTWLHSYDELPFMGFGVTDDFGDVVRCAPSRSFGPEDGTEFYSTGEGE